MSASETQSADLIRLVQHVALNESGWWDRAIERLTLACAYLLGPSTRNTLCAKVTGSSGVQVNSQRLLSTIERLIKLGSLVCFDGKIRVSEEMRISLSSHEAETLNAEERAYHRFEYLTYEHDLGDQIDELWPVLETEIILPIIRHIGANIYGKLSSNSSIDGTRIDSQINEFYERYGNKVKELFADYMDPADNNVRGFILRRLNAQYILDAAALPSDSLDRIAKLNTVPSRVNIFLDTNVLFNVLGLHSNPNDDTASELLELAHQLKSRVNLQLYVLPITIDESKRVLRGVISSLKNFRGQSNLAEAASQLTPQGFVARYLEEVQKSSTALTAQDFFGPYESDLLTILRSKSIELYNTDLDALRLDQKVIDDIHNQTDWQKLHRARGVKPYEANLHDMVIWHFIDRLRGEYLSPLEASSWIVTLDYVGLLSFDKYKQQNKRDGLSICLDPASLIHMFQFWIPSSSKLDEALVGSIRQPLLFLNFDTESEQITIKILEQLSRFIDAEDLTPNTVKEILINSALRKRISRSNLDQAEIDISATLDLPLVIREFNKKIEQTTHEIEQTTHEKEQIYSNYKAEYSLRDKAEKALSSEKKSRLHAEEEREHMASRLEKMESRISDLEKVNNKLNQDILNQTSRNEAYRVFIGTLITVFTSIVASFIVWAVIKELMSNDYVGIAGAVLCTLFVSIKGVEITVKGTRFADRIFFRWIAKRRWWTYTITTILSVGASLIADWIRDLI